MSSLQLSVLIRCCVLFAGLGAVLAPPLRAESAGGGAEVDGGKIPAGGPPPRLELPRPTRFRLASGIEVLVIERHTLPMAAIDVVWPIGATQDPAGRFGLANLTADLLDEGTVKLSSSELARRLEGLGTRLETFSSWDATGVAMLTLTRHLDRSLDLLAEVLAAPAFDAKELERSRARRVTALLERRDVAGQVAVDALMMALYGGDHRLGHPALGVTADLQAIRRDDVIEFARSWLRPDLATIIVAGDVKPEVVRRKLEKSLAGWRAAARAAPRPVPLVRPAPAPRLALVDRPGAPQTELRIGQPGVERASPDYFPLLVLNTIFGGQFSSRLNLNLRVAHGYTYGARSDMAFLRDGGPFLMAAPVKTEVTAAAVKEALAELRRLGAKDVTPAELRLAKDLLERAMAVRLETLSQVAAELASIAVYRLPDDYLSTYAARVEAVTLEDLARVARAHIDVEKMAVILVGDRRVLEPTLAALRLPRPELRDLEGKLLPAAATAAPATSGAPVPSTTPSAAPPRK